VSAVGFLIAFLFAWGNAPFTVAAGIAALFALLQLTGIVSLLAGGGEDHDVDHDVDGADVDADADADGEADADHDAEGHALQARPGAPGAAGSGSAVLAVLGLGRVPLSIIGETYALAFAATGLAVNFHYLASPSGPPLVSLAWTLPASLVVGYFVVGVVARVVGPVLSSRDQEATSRADLVGQIGVVISTRVDESFGEVRVRDKSGHDLRLVCKLHRGSVPAREHDSVVVVDYDPRRGDLLVAPFDDGPAGAPVTARLDVDEEVTPGGEQAARAAK
jgi:membrane protein implicated in regulation of membrane protease activity